MNIVMQHASVSDIEWAIPACSPLVEKIGPPLVEKKGQYIGDRLKVFVPEDMAIEINIGTDYSMAIISHSSKSGKELLVIGHGPTWSISGFPAWIKKEQTNVTDRDVNCMSKTKDEPNSMCRNVIDVRSYSEDGKYWRFIGDAFETIEYQAVSEDAAKIFDRIIDTLCSN